VGGLGRLHKPVEPTETATGTGRQPTEVDPEPQLDPNDDPPAGGG
jgi:hypothetical protein